MNENQQGKKKKNTIEGHTHGLQLRKDPDTDATLLKEWKTKLRTSEEIGDYRNEPSGKIATKNTKLNIKNST